MLFDALGRHLELVDQQLKSELKGIEDAMDAELEEDPEGEEGMLRAYNDVWMDAAWLMPTLQWWSGLLLVYALFEKQLNEVCTFGQTERGLQFGVVDMHGGGIERARIYLSKVLGLKNAFSSAMWARAKLLGELRNAIAHQAGMVSLEPADKRSLFCRLRALPNIEFREEVPDDGRAPVVFGRDFVEEAATSLRQLISVIARELEEELPRESKKSALKPKD